MSLYQVPWAQLERAAIRAVISGGTAAMALYRQAAPWPAELGPQIVGAKNPSTIADLEATAAILQTIDAHLVPIALRLGMPLAYLGEETTYQSWLQQHVAADVLERVYSAEAFFSPQAHGLRVIFDGIDGTGNFTRGIPIFCSAVALLIGEQARVAAVYDPIHQIVYSATLQGPAAQPAAQRSAWAWHMTSGNRVDLAHAAMHVEVAILNPAIAIHLTRSSSAALAAFIDAGPMGDSLLKRLAHIAGAIYAFNSGVVAMTDVAVGAIGGFVNTTTNRWDVAAGDVLVRACAGQVTDLAGAPIGYDTPGQTAVVAARGPLHATLLHSLRAQV